MNKIFTLVTSTFIVLSFACNDDSNESAQPTSPSKNGNSNTNPIVGTYTGTEITTYIEKGTSNVLLIDTVSETYSINGSGSGYQLQYDENGTIHSLDLNVHGNNFSASGASNNIYFAGETYSGSITADNLNMTYTGEDNDQGIDYTYTANYSGIRQSNGGNGGNNSINFLRVSGEDVGNFLMAKCAENFTASFEAKDNEEWHLTIYTLQDCDGSGENIGTFSIVEYDTGVMARECAIYLSKQDDNGTELLDLNSQNGSATATFSNVNGKKKITISEVSLYDSNNNINKMVSFSLIAQ